VSQLLAALALVSVLALVAGSGGAAANGGSYTASSASFAAVNFGSVAFGDYDSDGYLDAVVSGETSSGGVTKVYHYDSSSDTWSEAASLATVTYSSAAWGDYDSDGKLDLLVSGWYVNPITTLYRGDGSGGFSEVSGTGLTGVFDGDVAFGDYNSDGRPDILLTGAADNSRSTIVIKLYRNDGTGAFTDVTTGSGLSNVSFPGVQVSSVAWGDYNRDGRPDLLVAGCTANSGCSANPVTKLFRNDGGGSFSDSGASLIGVTRGSVAWGDYNADNWPDILVTGSDYNTIWKTKVYTNTGGSSFSENTSTSLPDVSFSSAAWGDHNADGLPDVVITGRSPSFTAAIYGNDGDGSFTSFIGLTGVSQSSAAWGDYDADGDLDVLIAGCTNSPSGIESCDTRNTTLWTSSMGVLTPDTPPSAPTGPAATPSGSEATLSWNAANDVDQASGAGLSYNVRVGTSPGASNVVSPLALTDGTRLVPATGNTGERTSYELTGLTHGQTYYWSVQAVDASFLGSPFAAEGSFVANDPPTAGAGGPYTISEGQSLQLDGSASSDPDSDSMTYAWKIDGKGTITGQKPAVSWSTLESLGLGDGPATLSASLTVTDSIGASSTSTATATLNNAPPTAEISGPSKTTARKSTSWTFSATDLSAADQAGTFKYEIDWNGDGSVDQTVSGGHSTTSSHKFSKAGSTTVGVTATDKNGGKSARVSKTVTVKPKANGKIKSAKLTKKTFSASQAKTVKLKVVFKPKSKLFRWQVSLKSGKKWQLVKSKAKHGSFSKKKMSVKALFSGKKMKKGVYRLRLSADRNSKTLKFRIV
jgi:hypothetical protein